MSILSGIRSFALFAGLVATCAAAFAGLGAIFKCTPPLPPWAMALLASTAIAATMAAYRRERAFAGRKTGRLLLSLRLAAIAAVLFMLMQPVLLRHVSRRVERTVAVLVDSSDSMRFNDASWSPGESLALAAELDFLDGGAAGLPSLPRLAESCRELRPWLEHPFPDAREPEACRRIAKRALASARDLRGELSREPFASSASHSLEALARALDSTLIPALGRIGSEPFRDIALAALDSTAEKLVDARAAADSAIWDSLDPSLQNSISNALATNRLSIACRVLEKSISPLASDYTLRHFSFGRHALPDVPGSIASHARNPFQSSATDFTAALEKTMEAVPDEELAGIVLLTDGISNGDAPVEPVARRLGSRGVRVSTVLIGSSAPPRDLAIADVSAPESVFLGDKVRVRSKLWAAGAAGETARVSLLLDGAVVDEASIPVSDDAFERDFSLAFAPTNSGLARFSIQIDQIGGERFPSNNFWAVDVAVSDDRTNVLLIDDYPRWDFRYLRNLFFARDKSVHLQYLLLHPDTIAGLETTNRPPAASASRPFGEAEAGSLPSSPDEWRKFDVIILGDVGPDVISNELAQTIAECVSERGALLVAIAGPRAMPHAYPDDSPIRALLPADYPDFSPEADYWKPPEQSFMPVLTQEGRRHQIVQQSASSSENDQIWRSLRPCSWRMPATGVKAGAEVIAYATPLGSGHGEPAAEDAPLPSAGNALEAMEAERAEMARNSLIVAHNVGRGKVLALNTDESWRLRYRIGDTRHHRFWGQVLRWGLGERLRSGDSRLRLGTERITYSLDEPVRLLARIADAGGNPVHDAKPTGIVRPAGDSTSTNFLHTAPLTPVAGSQGLYEAFLPPVAQPGAYAFELRDSSRFDGNSTNAPSAVFFVAASRRPMEMAHVAASAEVPNMLAHWTGGSVLSPDCAKLLEGSFGEKSRTVAEIEEIPLWDGKWLLALIVALLASEWTVRKRSGLV